MSTTVAAAIQLISPDHNDQNQLGVQEIEATADTYLDAVAKVESEVPDGYQVVVVRTVNAHAGQRQRVPN